MDGSAERTPVTGAERMSEDDMSEALSWVGDLHNLPRADLEQHAGQIVREFVASHEALRAENKALRDRIEELEARRPALASLGEATPEGEVIDESWGMHGMDRAALATPTPETRFEVFEASDGNLSIRTRQRGEAAPERQDEGSERG